MTRPAAAQDRHADLRPGSAGLKVFMLLVAVYALTAQWAHPYHIDALTNAVTGWYVGNEGSVIVDRHEQFADDSSRSVVAWFTESDRGPVSQYPPGAALVAGLFYAAAPGDLHEMDLWFSNDPDAGPRRFPSPPLWPATLSAVLTTAGAMALLTVVFVELGGDRARGMGAGLVAGLATGAWSVAADASWMHGPGMLFVAAAVLAVQRQRWCLAGLAFAGAILVRPHLALVVAALGLLILVRRRALRPVLALGMTSATGLLVLLAYNWWLFGEVSVSGGYGSGFSSTFATASPSWFVGNIARGLINPDHGLLVWAPFVVVLAIGALYVRRTLDWTGWLALGSIAYLLVQWRANHFAGGEGHHGYRYPLEAMVAAAPALYLGYERWVRPTPLRRRILAVTLAISFALQAAAAVW